MPLRYPAAVQARELPIRPLGECVASLTDPNADARRTAALELCGVNEAVRALAGQVGQERDRGALDAMLTALVETDSAAAVDGLVGYLRSDDAVLRNAVAEALAQMRSTASAIPSLLFDPDPDVRILTVMALGALPLPEVPGWLLQVAQTDRHANVVGGAVNELAEVGTTEMIPDLLLIPDRFPKDPFLRFAVDVVAARLRDGADR